MIRLALFLLQKDYPTNRIESKFRKASLLSIECALHAHLFALNVES